MTSRRSSHTNTSRRAFLRGSLTAAGVGAIALASNSASATTMAENPDATTPKKKPEGYHETSHIRKYYETART